MKKRYTILAHVQDKKGHYLSSTCNSYKKSHPLQKFFAEKVGHPEKIYLHAEVRALIIASLNGVPHTLNVVNHYKTPTKPCPICAYAARFFGVKYIKYQGKDGVIYGQTPEEICKEYGV